MGLAGSHRQLRETGRNPLTKRTACSSGRWTNQRWLTDFVAA
jgi:hypothetical protein